MKRSKTLALIPLLLLPACGSSTTGPSDPNDGPTVAPSFGVSGVVFYDENANGVLDPTEEVRLAGATIVIGGQSGQAGAEGRFTVSGVPAGAQTAQADAGGLPPYFVPGTAVTVSVPQASEDLAVPAVLEIGTNRANHYMAFGDSITSGVGGAGGGGYQSYLAADLRSYWGAATVINSGDPGSKSYQGEPRIGGQLARNRPAYTLILYGTNDWNDGPCRNDFACETIDSLRSMVLQARDAGSNPILGTIPPANPAWLDRGATERNIWVTQMNDLVRTMAAQEGVVIADIHADFLAQPDIPSLFADHVHPNDLGYQLMARTWRSAITSGDSTAASSGRAGGAFGFTPWGAN